MVVQQQDQQQLAGATTPHRGQAAAHRPMMAAVAAAASQAVEARPQLLRLVGLSATPAFAPWCPVAWSKAETIEVAARGRWRRCESLAALGLAATPARQPHARLRLHPWLPAPAASLPPVGKLLPSTALLRLRAPASSPSLRFASRPNAGPATTTQPHTLTPIQSPRTTTQWPKFLCTTRSSTAAAWGWALALTSEAATAEV